MALSDIAIDVNALDQRLRTEGYLLGMPLVVIPEFTGAALISRDHTGAPHSQIYYTRASARVPRPAIQTVRIESRGYTFPTFTEEERLVEIPRGIATVEEICERPGTSFNDFCRAEMERIARAMGAGSLFFTQQEQQRVVRRVRNLYAHRGLIPTGQSLVTADYVGSEEEPARRAEITDADRIESAKEWNATITWGPEGRFRASDGRRFDLNFSPDTENYPHWSLIAHTLGATFTGRRCERGTVEPGPRPFHISPPADHDLIGTAAEVAALARPQSAVARMRETLDRSRALLGETIRPEDLAPGPIPPADH